MARWEPSMAAEVVVEDGEGPRSEVEVSLDLASLTTPSRVGGVGVGKGGGLSVDRGVGQIARYQAPADSGDNGLAPRKTPRIGYIEPEERSQASITERRLQLQLHEETETGHPGPNVDPFAFSSALVACWSRQIAIHSRAFYNMLA
ncbi:hypothetical protein E4U27_005134 [Claviceps purpurea]|nr:hypothetical protein E4U27_005134 [Claviceps purpurea]